MCEHGVCVVIPFEQRLQRWSTPPAWGERPGRLAAIIPETSDDGDDDDNENPAAGWSKNEEKNTRTKIINNNDIGDARVYYILIGVFTGGRAGGHQLP